MNISIAMCTYNGEHYLQQQLESIISQSLQPSEIVICDDGSTDMTVSILKEFLKTAPFPVHIQCNSINIGVVANFLQAISLCKGSIIALADQDDIWLPNKLQRGIAMIQKQNNPEYSMYCSRLQFIDSHMKTIGLSSIPKAINFSNAVLENIATGCSVIFGSEIRRLVLQADPKKMAMHDWWIYLLATAFGEVIYDSTPTILYRRHNTTVTGWEPRPVKIWNRISGLIRRLRTDKRGMDSLNQAAEFIKIYSEIEEERRLVEQLLTLRDADLFSRMSYAKRPLVQRNNALEQFGFKVMVIMGWH